MNTPTQQTDGESATLRTDEAQILASFNEVEPPHYPRAFLAVPADFARQLERETATLHAQLGEANALLDEAVSTLQILVMKVQKGEARSKETYAAHLEMLNKIFAHRAALPLFRGTAIQQDGRPKEM